MNKIEVGNAPSPNLKKVQSKIGSLQNASHKPGKCISTYNQTWALSNCESFLGGGNVKIESKKLEIKIAAPRIEAKNNAYVPKGGDKKVSRKLFEPFQKTLKLID